MMIDIVCPNCHSPNVGVARDMKATRRCYDCLHRWLPEHDGVSPNDTIALGVPEMFASKDEKFICWKGHNYYKGCGEVVYENEDGSTAMCVKPFMHVHYEHESMDGRISARRGGSNTFDDANRSYIRSALLNSGLDDTQVYNTMNALFAEGITMIKEP